MDGDSFWHDTAHSLSWHYGMRGRFVHWKKKKKREKVKKKKFDLNAGVAPSA